MSVSESQGTIQVTNNEQVTKQNLEKEQNFRRQEQLYQRKLEEREARIRELEAIAAQKQKEPEEDEDLSEYVDHKKLNKTLARFGENTKKQTQSEIQIAVQTALQEERKANWIKNHSDFYEVLQYAEKFAQKDPELAETILEMPEGFERQKLVYKNIKALGLDKPEQRQQTTQEKVDANRRSPYYQPSGVGSAPYAGAVGDFSPSGQKAAHDKMQELKARLRL